MTSKSLYDLLKLETRLKPGQRVINYTPDCGRPPVIYTHMENQCVQLGLEKYLIPKWMVRLEEIMILYLSSVRYILNFNTYICMNVYISVRTYVCVPKYVAL